MGDVILLYSGGLDSVLSACRLVCSGYKVHLIHFDNGSSIGSERVLEGAKHLEETFGEKIDYLGVIPIIGTVNRFKKIENQKFSQIAKEFGNLSISQYQCLLCRSAMYYNALGIALENGYSFIAEGARISQKFAIEQTPMINEYRALLNNYGIELLTPVIELDDDYQRTLEISYYGLPICAYEAKCFLGYPIDEENPVSDEVVSDTVEFFRKFILPEIDKLMNDKYSINRFKYLRYEKDKVKWM